MAEVGGAGSTCCAGAGGYTAGSASSNPKIAQNGKSGYGYNREKIETKQYMAGGYFEGPNLTVSNIKMSEFVLGGHPGVAYAYKGHEPGTGGAGGSGGNIQVSKDAKVYASNGNLYTDGTNVCQCPIYLQTGVKIAQYETGYANSTTNWNKWTLTRKSEQKNDVNQSGYINDNNKGVFININDKIGITTNKVLKNVDMSKQGVGSGAGYIEVSNGTYTIK